MFSARTNWPLEANPLTRLIQSRRKSGLPILDLTESNPTHCGFHYGGAPLESLLDPRALGYEPSPHGLLSARQAVAEYYAERGVALKAEQIFLTSSTSEAYTFVFRLLGNPGDVTLVPRPSYPLFDFLARLNDLHIVRYETAYDQAWHIDRASVEGAIAPESRAILVVHPNNPTGSFVHLEELDFLVGLAQKHKLALISDEVFSDYAHPQTSVRRAPSFAGEKRALTFTLSGLSKISALPQMKCAWLVVNGPAPLRRDALDRIEVIADTYLSLSTPIACALPQFLGLRHTIQPQIHERLRANLSRLDSLIARGSPASRLHIEGGWYAVLRLPCIRSDEEWALRFLREDGVLIHPGHFYDFAAEGHVVVSLLPQPGIFSEAIEKLLARVESDT